MTAVTHGHNDTTGVYESTAFFLRHDPSGQELLFFGDVEPNSVASRPLTLATWRAAAPMIPETLCAIFIECSWPLGRREDLLYGHLSPEHLADELAALATEVVRVRGGSEECASEDATPVSNGGGTSVGKVQPATTGRRAARRARVAPYGVPAPHGHPPHGVDVDEPPSSDIQPLRKKPRPSPVDPELLRDALKGLRVYITHCKDDLEGRYDRPIRHVIADQVRELVEKKRLGAEILSVEQGSRIGPCYSELGSFVALTLAMPLQLFDAFIDDLSLSLSHRTFTFWPISTVYP